VIERDEQKLVIRRVFRNGRRRYDPLSKGRLVAACLVPGASVSRLALDNGINANLLRKWVKEAKATGPAGVLCSPAFIPAVIENGSLSTERAAARGEMCLAAAERAAPFSTPLKVSASLANGVKLTVECGDERMVSAMIGALSNVPAVR
jgi:transposase